MDSVPKIETTQNGQENTIVIRRDFNGITAIVGILGMALIWLPGEFDLIKQFKNFSSETVIAFFFFLVWQLFGIIFISLISASIFGNTIALMFQDNKLTRIEKIGRIRTQKLKVYEIDKMRNPRIEEAPRNHRGRKWIEYDIVFDYSGQKQNVLLFLKSKEKAETFFLQFQNLLKETQKSS